MSFHDSEEVYKNVSYGGTLEDYLNIYNPPRAPGKAIYYSGLNNYRLPNYHRLDVGINFSKKKKFGQRIWNVSVYNLYNQSNGENHLTLIKVRVAAFVIHEL